jgi:3-dehydroquinate dehydratase II
MYFSKYQTKLRFSIDSQSERLQRIARHEDAGCSARLRRETMGKVQEKRMTARLMILNGPNLNLLGVREPHIYGSTTLDAVKACCEEFARFAGAKLAFHQSNHEGVLIDYIQAARQDADAIIINPAAYSFTSIAMLDALRIFEGPVLEVHISNIHARDEVHRHSKLSSAVKAVIAGLGPYGYVVAMQAALHALGKMPQGFPPAMRDVPR